MSDCALNAVGGVQIYIYDKNNNLKQYVKTHNRVVDTGCEMIASLIAGPTADSNFIDIVQFAFEPLPACFAEPAPSETTSILHPSESS